MDFWSYGKSGAGKSFFLYAAAWKHQTRVRVPSLPLVRRVQGLPLTQLISNRCHSLPGSESGRPCPSYSRVPVSTITLLPFTMAGSGTWHMYPLTTKRPPKVTSTPGNSTPRIFIQNLLANSELFFLAFSVKRSVPREGSKIYRPRNRKVWRSTQQI